jgi:hypothetical protein
MFDSAVRSVQSSERVPTELRSISCRRLSALRQSAPAREGRHPPAARVSRARGRARGERGGSRGLPRAALEQTRRRGVQTFLRPTLRRPWRRSITARRRDAGDSVFEMSARDASGVGASTSAITVAEVRGASPETKRGDGRTRPDPARAFSRFSRTRRVPSRSVRFIFLRAAPRLTRTRDPFVSSRTLPCAGAHGASPRRGAPEVLPQRQASRLALPAVCG